MKILRNEDQLWIAREMGTVGSFSISENVLSPGHDLDLFYSNAHEKNFSFHSDLKKEVVIISQNAGITLNSLKTDYTSRNFLHGMDNVQAAALKGHFLAVGGKGSKNNLKIYDLSQEDFSVPIYSAKPTLDTRLDSHFLVDIRAICFTHESNNFALAVSNADGQIFTYDFSRQNGSTSNRQVMPKKTVISSLSRAEKDGSVIFTDVSGVIECYDLVAGKSYGRFKPHDGAVLSFAVSEKNLLILTVSKDRFLRIFNYSTRQLLHKIYLKNVPSALTILSEDWLTIEDFDYEDSDDEKVWEGMTTVADSKKKRAKRE